MWDNIVDHWIAKLNNMRQGTNDTAGTAPKHCKLVQVGEKKRKEIVYAVRRDRETSDSGSGDVLQRSMLNHACMV